MPGRPGEVAAVNLSSLVIPALLAGVAVCGMGRRVDVYGALTHGAEEGLTVLLKVLPALVGLLTAVSMFRASGALEWLTGSWSLFQKNLQTGEERNGRHKAGQPDRPRQIIAAVGSAFSRRFRRRSVRVRKTKYQAHYGLL